MSVFGPKAASTAFYAIPFFVGMGYWHRLLAWLQELGYDKYGESAYEKLDELRRYHLKKHGDDLGIQYEQVGKILQHHIDSMNDQGGLESHKYALARWQIYRALYPDYISDKPPKIVNRMWLDPKIGR